MALTADIQQQVYDLLSRSSNISFISTDQESGSRLALTPGQRVSAEVLTTFPNNRVQVRIGTERFNLDLPMAVRQGQTLEMTFISEDPRSTFAIARQGGITPPVSLSDASRLLSLLVSSEQIVDPKLRSSLQSIGEMLRRSSGEAGVLANLMDEALTYGGLTREGVKASSQTPGGLMDQSRDDAGGGARQAARQLTPDQMRLATFESNAAQILKNIAQSSRFILVESVNQPIIPLPFMPGEELGAAVIGTLPGGRAFVQVAGTVLELVLPRSVQAGEILRLTYLSSQPKPLFALPRLLPETVSGMLSEAGRWLSVLEHSEGGISDQQMYVLERLNTVLKSLPPDSPAFTAIFDEARTYDRTPAGRPGTDQQSSVAANLAASQPQQQMGNGVTLSDDMAKLLQAVIKGNRLALLEAINQQSQSSVFAPGQQLKGEVLSSLGGGRFMVQIAEQLIEFSMPRGTKRGDSINLFFIAEEPRQTFLMTRFGRPCDARVSETSRWLSGFLGETAEKVPAQTALGVLRTLLEGPPLDALRTSEMLRQGLRESGLFYESHLARWFGGEYPLEDIMKEPQGRLSPRINLPVHRLPAEILFDQLALSMSEHLSEAESLEAVMKRAVSASAHEALADRRTLPVVQEQLAALQSGQMIFRGDLFPGQTMEWKVSEQESHRRRNGQQEKTWESEISLELPKLGKVGFRVALVSGAVSVNIQTDNESAAGFLASGQAGLAEQLEAAGLTGREIKVRHGSL